MHICSSFFSSSWVWRRDSGPILVVIGKKGIQVDWRKDGGALETATGSGSMTFAYPENADHVLTYELQLREELTAAEVGAQYNAEGRVLDPEVFAVITNWLVQRSYGRAFKAGCAPSRLDHKAVQR